MFPSFRLVVFDDDIDNNDDDACCAVSPPRGASGNTKVAKQTDRPRRPEDGGRCEFEARSVFMGIGVGTEQPQVSGQGLSGPTVEVCQVQMR